MYKNTATISDEHRITPQIAPIISLLLSVTVESLSAKERNCTCLTDSQCHC